MQQHELLHELHPLYVMCAYDVRELFLLSTCQLLSTESGQMTKVGLGPSCAVFSLPVFGDIVACDTVGHSFATALPELEAKKGIIRCKN